METFYIFQRRNKRERDWASDKEGKESISDVAAQMVRSQWEFWVVNRLSPQSVSNPQPPLPPPYFTSKLHAASHSSLLQPKKLIRAMLWWYRDSFGWNACLVNRRAWVQIPAVGLSTITLFTNLRTSDIDALGTLELSASVKAIWGCGHSGLPSSKS